ncbi:sensor histidine kinase [Streptomyces antarcticus]|uniref:sensor histidine kinase n=1 Tax=Streptomyces antarcticus TaxID=2996458 RepID=UPI00226D4D34|nr:MULTISPECIES: sensor histidine kinase [unclassified Streptomyces]MCY0949539.1 sensor histidine kinase [Streptomyces sp. H27-S2]MCZ4084637.1 sensor histidine kinase [Streptomyces sp. H34-S5]
MSDRARNRPRGRTSRRTPSRATSSEAASSPAGPSSSVSSRAASSPAAGARVPGALAQLSVVLRTPARAAEPLLARAPRTWQRVLPFVVVGLFTLTLLPVTIAVLTNVYKAGGGWSGALGVAQTVPLLLAVTRPMRAWAMVLVADTLGAVLLIQADDVAGRAWPWTPMVIIGYLALMACLGLRESIRTLVGVWLATGAVGALLAFFEPPGAMNTAALLFVLSGVVLALTGALRGLGDAQQRIAEQKSISEAERSRRTLLEERARIARELHDVVAHHMSVITVQADSAPYRLPGMPEPVREEFAAIAASARESLGEMRRLLTVLRGDGANGADGERAPQPGIDRLQQLVEATVRAGQPVELSLAAGAAGAAPPAVGLSAYRIVQEALANVVRHAPGAPASVSVTVDADEVLVLVVNGPARDAVVALESSGTGHGLVGMRERVRLTGGTLDTGPLPDGGFRVAARLPLDHPTEDAS